MPTLVTVADYKANKPTEHTDALIELALDAAEQAIESLAGPTATRIVAHYNFGWQGVSALELPRPPDRSRLADISVTIGDSAYTGETFLQNRKYLSRGTATCPIPWYGEVTVDYYAVDDTPRRKLLIHQLAESELASYIHSSESFDGESISLRDPAKRRALILRTLAISKTHYLAPAYITYNPADQPVAPGATAYRYAILAASGGTPGDFDFSDFTESASASVNTRFPVFTANSHIAIVLPEAQSLAALDIGGVNQLAAFPAVTAGGNRYYISHYQLLPSAFSGQAVTLRITEA